MRKVFSLGVSVVALGMLSASQMSCSDSDNKITDGTAAKVESIPNPLIAVAAVAADYSAANFEIVSGDYTVTKNLYPGLSTDLVVRTRGNYAYILERLGSDKVIKTYSKEKVDGAVRVEYETVLGPGLNIQDIAFVSDTKAYISSHETSDLIVFNPTTGKTTSTVSLARFNTFAGTADAEASPYASSLAVYGNYVYVACQRLKNFSPADTSLIAVVDWRADTVFTSIKLNRRNPSSLDVFGSRLLVSSSGDYYDPEVSGGVEEIDLTSNTNLGVRVEESAFGGSLSALVSVSLDKAYISVMGDDWNTNIVPFNPMTGTAGAKIAGIVDGFGGMAYDGTKLKLYVGERGFGAATGVLVINPNTDAVERTVATGMPPSSIAVIFGD